MSMISGQIDELRAMAQLEKSLEKPAIARILDDAADTIWELRDDLQRTNAENAKLRELIADVHEALCADKAGMFHRLTLASMEDDMRELGIEVDG